MFQNIIHTYPIEGHWKFQGSWKSLENLNFKRRVQYYQLNFWMVLVTSTSMIGCGAIFEPPPFLCHCCNWDVQAMGACESSSSNRSFVEEQLNKENLHNLNIRANTWLQNPTLPAMHEQQALLTPPGKMHRAIFRVCGGSFFRKLWQHLLLK